MTVFRDQASFVTLNDASSERGVAGIDTHNTWRDRVLRFSTGFFFGGGGAPGHSNQMPQPFVDGNYQILKMSLNS